MCGPSFKLLPSGLWDRSLVFDHEPLSRALPEFERPVGTCVVGIDVEAIRNCEVHIFEQVRVSVAV